MNFEEWWGSYQHKIESAGYEAVARLTWEAATYAANVRDGDASNESEKEARRQKALTEIYVELGIPRPKLGTFNKLDAIIKIAQG